MTQAVILLAVASYFACIRYFIYGVQRVSLIFIYFKVTAVIEVFLFTCVERVHLHSINLIK